MNNKLRILNDSTLTSIRDWKVSNLPSLVELKDNDYIMICAADEKVSCKVTMETLRKYLKK